MMERRGPTVSQLQHDIQRGRTASKVNVHDPAAAPLGTDEEAAGTPLRPAEVEVARRQENYETQETDPDRSNKYSTWSGVMMWIGAVMVLVVSVGAALLLTRP
jgi:hypothetical protein